MRKSLLRKYILLTGIGLLCAYLTPIQAQQLSVEADVSSQEVFRGEELRLEIHINGSNKPAKPEENILERKRYSTRTYQIGLIA